MHLHSSLSVSESLVMISMNDRSGALQHWNIVACILKSSHAFCRSLKAKIRSTLNLSTERIIHTFVSSHLQCVVYTPLSKRGKTKKQHHTSPILTSL